MRLTRAVLGRFESTTETSVVVDGVVVSQRWEGRYNMTGDWLANPLDFSHICKNKKNQYLQDLSKKKNKGAFLKNLQWTIILLFYLLYFLFVNVRCRNNDENSCIMKRYLEFFFCSCTFCFHLLIIFYLKLFFCPLHCFFCEFSTCYFPTINYYSKKWSQGFIEID